MEPEPVGPWDELSDDPALKEGDDGEGHGVPGDLIELHEVLEYKALVDGKQDQQ